MPDMSLIAISNLHRFSFAITAVNYSLNLYTYEFGSSLKLVSQELNHFCHLVHGFSQGCTQKHTYTRVQNAVSQYPSCNTLGLRNQPNIQPVWFYCLAESLYYIKYGSSIITSKIWSKILSNENKKKTGVSRKIVCFGILIHVFS